VQIAPFYREYDLPWEAEPEERRRYIKILRVGLVLLVVFSLLFILLPPPKAKVGEETVPPRLARVMIQQQPKPPPPPPPKVEEQPKPKIEEKRVAAIKPPVDKQQQARQKAQNSGLLQFQDELADLRDKVDLDVGQTKNLTGAVGADSHAERSMITSKVGAGDRHIPNRTRRRERARPGAHG
jgi:protein TonB